MGEGGGVSPGAERGVGRWGEEAEGAEGAAQGEERGGVVERGSITTTGVGRVPNTGAVARALTPLGEFGPVSSTEEFGPVPPSPATTVCV